MSYSKKLYLNSSYVIFTRQSYADYKGYLSVDEIGKLSSKSTSVNFGILDTAEFNAFSEWLNGIDFQSKYISSNSVIYHGVYKILFVML